MTVARRLVFPVCLLVGPLLVIVAGTLHPDLAGDGAAQLAAIAQCSAWRAIHWTFLFDMIQPFALAAQRVAGFALGLSTCLFAWGVSDGKVLPRWLATGGLAAGAVAMALALVFREDTKADQAAFVLPVLWQLVTGAVGLLLSARPETDDAPGPAVRRVGTA